MKRLFFWLMADISILIGLPILHYLYLARMLDYEYANGIRTSSDGDSILIPVVGLFIFLFVVLLIINLVVAGYYIWTRRRHRTV
jgi:O-antigen/teichoic acid export membrane protein